MENGKGKMEEKVLCTNLRARGSFKKGQRQVPERGRPQRDYWEKAVGTGVKEVFKIGRGRSDG